MATSPDLSAYNPLVLYDALPQDLVARAIPARAVYTPDYNPVEGDVDLEQQGSLAAMICEYVYALNRLPDNLFYLLSNIEGVPRLEGTPAQVTLRFTVTPNPLGVDIPNDFLASLDLGNGDTVVFATTVPVRSAANATTVDATAVATEPGTFANAIPPGTILDPQTALPAVEQVKVQAASGGGTDPEDDQAFLSRYATRRQRSTAALATPLHFQYYAADEGGPLGVFRARAIDKWDADTDNTPGTVEGAITVAVAGTNGATIPTDSKAQLEAEMGARSNLQVYVTGVNITDVDVHPIVVTAPGFDDATVTANITAALAAYLSPDTWPWGKYVYRNELVSVIDNAGGVDRVDTISGFPTSLALTGPAPLARLGTVTVDFTTNP